jgi:hypothetical protein
MVEQVAVKCCSFLEKSRLKNRVNSRKTFKLKVNLEPSPAKAGKVQRLGEYTF